MNVKLSAPYDTLVKMGYKPIRFTKLEKIKKGLKILWDCSFDFGKRLTKIYGKRVL